LVDNGVRDVVGLVLNGDHLAHRIVGDGALRYDVLEKSGRLDGVSNMLFEQIEEVERLGEELERHETHASISFYRCTQALISLWTERAIELQQE
jgi:hypothetical protein